MLANLGSYFLFFSIVISVAALSFPLILNSNSDNYQSDYYYKFSLYSANTLVIISFIIMLSLFVIQDFRVVSVMLNTSSLMSLNYRIAACWSSHETSLLFWVFITAFLNIVFIYQTSAQEKVVNSITHLIQAIFLLCIFFTSNPFKTIESKPLEGLGMNPSLQDIGIMIHPPLLYLSYSIFQIIYSCNIASLFGASISKSIILDWARFGLAILSIAVCLGGWWAYRELGWGGYWLFDPVENISLIIWLFAISYHHSLLQKNMEFTKLVLGICPFIFALAGTFFVRSGLLTSIHSFAESPSSFILLIFSCITLVISFAAIILRANNFLQSNAAYSNKYYFMQSSNILWSFAGIILIISIIIPIIFTSYFGETIEVKPSFFIKTIIPIMLLASLLAGLVYFNKNFPRLFIIILANSSVMVFAYVLFQASLLISFAYYAGSIIISSSLIRLYEKIKGNSLNTGSISMLLGHISAGIFIIAVSFNNQYGFSKTINIAINEQAEIKDKKYAYLADINYSHGANYLRQIANIRIMDGKKEVAILKPELRFYPIEKSFSSEVDIYHFLLFDWYAVINNIEDNKASFQIFYHPAISIIWLSVFLASFAIILRAIKKK